MPTNIEDVGEFGLIDRIAKTVKSYQNNTHTGIGDDAAVIRNDGEFSVLSTDMLVEGVHFDLSFHPLKHLGYKAAVVNFSDLAAMNALPTQLTVSLGLSNRFGLEAVDELYKGIAFACAQYKVDLVGGDTTASRSGLIISVTAYGQAKKDELSYRSGAKEGEILCVSGDLGAAYLGLQILEREKRVFLANPQMQPKLEAQSYVVMRQLKPEARTDLIHTFKDLDLRPTAMIDVSDGLASEVIHLCKSAGLSAVVYEEKIPIEKETFEAAAALNLSPTICALNGGEDYELLFTIPVSEQHKLKQIADVSLIGYTRKGSEKPKLVTRGGQTVDLEAQGWQHFSKS